MVKVVLFVGQTHVDTMDREVVPRVGDSIVLDCGDMVRVIEVSHQWDDPTFVQVNCKELKI